jgi:hypothetical protein
MQDIRQGHPREVEEWLPSILLWLSESNTFESLIRGCMYKPGEQIVGTSVACIRGMFQIALILSRCSNDTASV